MPITPQLKRQPSRPMPVPVPEPRRRVSLQLEDQDPEPAPLPKPRRSNELGGPSEQRPIGIVRAPMQGPNHTAPHRLITPDNTAGDDVDLDDMDNADHTVHYSRLRSRTQTAAQCFGDTVAGPAMAPAPEPAPDTAQAQNAFLRAVQAAEIEEKGPRRCPSTATKDLTVRGAGLYAEFVQNQQAVNVGESRNYRARPAFRSEPMKARVMASSFDDIVSPIAASPLPSPSPSPRCPLPRGPLRRTSSRNQSFSQLSRHSSASSLSSSCGALESLGRMSLRLQPELLLASAQREAAPRQQHADPIPAGSQQHPHPRQPSGPHHPLASEPRPAPAYPAYPRQPSLRRGSQPNQQTVLQPQAQYSMQRPPWFNAQPAPVPNTHALPAYVQQILAGGVDALQQQRPQPMGGLSAAWQQHRAAAEDAQPGGWQLRAGGGIDSNPSALGMAPVDIHQPSMARMRSLAAEPAGVTPPSAALAASSLAAAALSGSYNDLVRGALSRHNSQSWGQHFLGSAESPVFA